MVSKLHARPTAGNGCGCATELMEHKDPKICSTRADPKLRAIIARRSTNQRPSLVISRNDIEFSEWITAQLRLPAGKRGFDSHATAPENRGRKLELAFDNSMARGLYHDR